MINNAAKIQKRNTIPVGYKETEVGIIPEEWRVVSVVDVISEISMGPFGSDIKVSNFVKTGVPLLSGFNVSTSKLKDSFINFVTKEKARELKKAVAVRGDIIVTHRGTIGQISYIPEDSLYEKYVISQSQFRVRFNKDIIPAWVALYFLSPKGASKLLEGKGHTGVPAIAQATTTFRKLQLPCPSIVEQIAITKTLIDIDTLITAHEQLITKKQSIKTATMQQLLTGRTRLPLFSKRPDGIIKGYKNCELGFIPEDWTVVQLKDVCFFENGDRSSNYPTPDSFVESGIPFINAGHIDEGIINQKDMNFITYKAFKKLGGGKVKPNDILFCLRGSLGKFGIIPDDFGLGAIASSLVIIRTKQQLLLLDYFASGYLKSSICEDMIELWAGGAAQPNLGAQELGKFLLPLPPVSEQRAIATILSDMDTEIAILEKKLAKIRNIKQGMMQQLLTGRIRLPLDQQP